MKNLIKSSFCAFLLLSFFSSFSQEKFEVTGVWVGEIFNDSTQQYIPFELAVSQRNGVFSGYSYTVFTVDSVENIGVKEVTITEKNGKLIVKDKKLIDDNYADRPAKGVYTTFELNHSQNDTADFLNGRWFTNKTRLFYPLSGTASLSKKKRIYETRIVQRLSYLGLANRLSFVNPHSGDVAKQHSGKPADESMMTIVEPELIIELPKAEDEKAVVLPRPTEVAEILESVWDTTAPKEHPPKGENIIAATTAVKPAADATRQAPKNQEQEVATTPEVSTDKLPETTAGKPADSGVSESSVTAQKRSQSQIVAKPANAAEIRGEQKPVEAKSLEITVGIAGTVEEPAVEKSAKEVTASADPLKQSAAEVERAKTQEAITKNLATRKVETIQAVKIAGDSIVLSLFDNGIVDGDTVSVLLNDQVIISKIGLLTTAYNHTLHLTPEMGDSLKLILYAENLGSIPPNTGLLVIRDGKKNHEIRFSGDLRNNSAVILLRNREE